MKNYAMDNLTLNGTKALKMESDFEYTTGGLVSNTGLGVPYFILDPLIQSSQSTVLMFLICCSKFTVLRFRHSAFYYILNFSLLSRTAILCVFWSQFEKSIGESWKKVKSSNHNLKIIN